MLNRWLHKGGSGDAGEIAALVRSRIPFAEEYYDLLSYEASPFGGYRLCPNQQQPHLTVNSLGFRGADFTGKESILLLGDSVTFGVGASGDDSRFSNFLATATATPIADASVRAYRVCQQREQLPGLLDLLPSVNRCVVWFGYADFLYWSTTGGRIDGVFELDLKYAGRAPRGALERYERGFFDLCRSVRKGLLPVREPHAKTGTIEDLVRSVVHDLEAIRDVAQVRGVAVTVLIQPFIRERPTADVLRTICDYYSSGTFRRCGVNWYEAAEQYVDLLLDGLSRLALETVIDLTPDTVEDDFFDQVHLKESSLRRLAELVAGRLDWKPTLPH